MEGTGQNKARFSNLLDRVSEALGELGGYAVATMVIIVTINMLTRSLLNAPIPGFYDITGVLGITFYSFSIVYAAIKGVHISVTFVLDRVPERFRSIVEFVNRAIIVVFCALLAYAGGSVAWRNIGEVTDDIKIPVAPFRFVFVIVLVILILLILAGKQISKGDDQ